MKKVFHLLLLGLFLCTAASAQQQYIKVPVAFYNLENLFDTEKGPNQDSDYLPEGRNKWTEERYKEKLSNMADVISRIGGRGPAVIGVSEIENRRVLEDLVAQPQLAHLGYSIVHYDSPDLRGIDCALLYRPEIFRLTNSSAHPVNIPGEPHIKTRDVVLASGKIDGENFHFLVGHWPSRAGGEAASIHRRMAAARVMRTLTDSIVSADETAKVILMGDFNDDPTSPSVAKGLDLKEKADPLAYNELFTPMLRLYKNGIGTLAYRDVWNLFDIICVNGNLTGNNYSSFRLYQDPNTEHLAFVFNKPFLRQKEGKFKGYPLRTMVGGAYQGGYSDHFPVYIYLVKEIKQ
ncbi:Endonuclease/Exonuclease/phosphatase family [Porphyromonas crevioricanis]|uniref:Endonuclease/Exonuclease/phosphatase family n=1 Tax=Porphyromonas crevioricanis TaxID=393921 RepID=A0A2X4PLD9_9PORP|nr:endonuclease/exonuclease/phosphatase family protein [Porphyromonas crevioricanis]GAD07332.1 hypothetical protein PORCAN_952 [Porphyromonas crevioricanis JCM 13913]SQH72268.1 Endonuclease/Exonuclease/phosphatase family [Porphyromonas crevioricanis]